VKTRAEIELLVGSLLSRHNVQGPPVNVKNIAISEGLQVFEMPLSGDVSGALLRSNGASIIAVHDGDPPNRRRFSIGHELAHHFLSHEGEGEHLDWKFTVLRRDGKSSQATDAHEIEANFFAASLLMPKDFLRKDVAQFARFNGEAALGEGDIQELARRYEVSKLAMSYRLVSLGLIDPNSIA
jgi:Zn-dependent peptidase ImmA (M78 family)